LDYSLIVICSCADRAYPAGRTVAAGAMGLARIRTLVIIIVILLLTGRLNQLLMPLRAKHWEWPQAMLLQRFTEYVSGLVYPVSDGAQ